MADKNTPLFILSPIIPYRYLFWVEEGEEANTLACFPHHLETLQAIYKAENSITLKIRLEYVRRVCQNLCFSKHFVHLAPS